MFFSFKEGKSTLRVKLMEKSRDADGKQHKETLKNFGPLPVENAEQAKKIEGLLRNSLDFTRSYYNKKPTLKEVKFSDRDFCDFMNGIELEEEKNNYSLAVLFLDKAMENFNLQPFFRRVQRETKRGYDFSLYFRFLVYCQILFPESIQSYYQEKDRVLRFMRGSGELKEHGLYRFLDWFYENREEIQTILFESTIKLVGKRKVYIVYYDGSNFYFSVSQADPENLDELDRHVKEGMRKYGISKEKRHDKPLVALGVLSCDLGIPLFFTVFPGNEQEISHITTEIDKLRKAMAANEMMGRFLLGADAGLRSRGLYFYIAGENKKRADEALKENDAYVIGIGSKNLSKETKKWILNPEGYSVLSRGKKRLIKNRKKRKNVTYFKSRVVYEPVTLKSRLLKSQKVDVRLKEIALKSTAREAKEIKAIEKKVNKALLKSESPARMKKELKKMTNDYLDIVGFNDGTGEVSPTFKGDLDKEKIKKDLEMAGYFALGTSEVHMPDGKVISIYRDKISAEMVFKNLKSVLKTRPMFVRTPKRIVAHIDLCVIALILLSTIRVETEKKTGEKLTEKKIAKSLSRISACPVGYNTFNITGIDGAVKSMFEAYGVPELNDFELERDLWACFSEKPPERGVPTE